MYAGILFRFVNEWVVGGYLGFKFIGMGIVLYDAAEKEDIIGEGRRKEKKVVEGTDEVERKKERPRERERTPEGSGHRLSWHP